MLYFPKLDPEKKHYNSVAKYNKETISKLLYYYLSHGLNYKDIESWVLGVRKSGYESIKIIKYFGLTRSHAKLYKDFDYKKMVDEIKQSDNVTDALMDYLVPNLKFNNLDIIFNDSLNPNVSLMKEKLKFKNLQISNSSSELYYNQLMKIRNMSIQTRFRNQLLDEFDYSCAVCSINKLNLLVASHILPYSRSNGDIEIAGNKENGLLLCTMHDSLFESGNYITFDFSSGNIIISEKIDPNFYSDYKLIQDLKLTKKYMTDKRKDFLFLHNQMFFQKNNKIENLK